MSATAKRFGKTRRTLTRSYITLFLVLLLSLTFSFAWFAKLNVADTGSGLLEFQSASSLRINKDKSSANKITIPAFTLDEASSLDGRNIYFPLGESFNTNTAEMFFREANSGDRITGKETGSDYTNNPEKKGHYIYKDFELKGTSGNTPVYIKSYEIKVEEADTAHNPEVNAVYHDQLTVSDSDNDGKLDTQTIPHSTCPIRMAFIADSGTAPVVIDPSAQVIDYVDNSPGAVERIDENGVPVLRNTYPENNWNSFQSYYYGNTPLFVIPGGETLNVTLVIWLEGTLPECDKYIGKKISVDIDIESNFVDMDTITFYDDSQPDKSGGQAHWVSNDNPIIACSYEDPFSDEDPKRWKTVIMTKSPSAQYTWTAKIPKKAVSNISFYRLSRQNGSTQSTIYNAWHTTESISTWITASSIPNNWYASGDHQDLQTTRQFFDNSTNTYTNALVYTAVHGNGYSITSDTAKRLAPCVGYWNYTSGSDGGDSGGGQQGGGGGSSSSSYAIEVNVETTKQPWIDSNVNNNHEHLYFHTSNGEKKELSRIGQNSFRWSGNLEANDEITKFSIENTSNSVYRTWNASPTFTVRADWIANFYVNQDNNLMVLTS